MRVRTQNSIYEITLVDKINKIFFFSGKGRDGYFKSEGENIPTLKLGQRFSTILYEDIELKKEKSIISTSPVKAVEVA